METKNKRFKTPCTPQYVSLVDILKGDKGVLVQCSTGCSRSAVVVVVYLALKHIVHGIEVVKF